MAWGALKYENRLLLAAGSAVTASPLRALLGLDPLDVATLLALVGREAKAGEGKAKGWYKGGAYCEAVMRQRLFAFIAAYGAEKGQRHWQQWYTGCKRRAGEDHDAWCTYSAHHQSHTSCNHRLIHLSEDPMMMMMSVCGGLREA
jgi:hypothetical protein